jgi:hypothetical protein
MLSKATELALKSKTKYLDNDKWLVYYHALSGDELKNQILSIGHKPTDKLVSFSFLDLSNPYKENEEQGIANKLQKDFKVETDELVFYVLEFLNEAKIEYTGKPFIVTMA